ncbi:MAG: hypothetical protein IJ451_03205 [Ruminococcus sp.]|nr:hypothetical protein [Ruminococcus sp.]
MDKMQEEAMRRVRQMQSANSAQKQAENSQIRKSAEIDTRSTPQRQETDKTEDTALGDPLSGLFKDKEKLLVLLLIMLLSQESYNTELVLALLYIII